jgi:hypothetical protein
MRLHDGAATRAIMEFATAVIKWIDTATSGAQTEAIALESHDALGDVQQEPEGWQFRYLVYCSLEGAFARTAQEGDSFNLGACEEEALKELRSAAFVIRAVLCSDVGTNSIVSFKVF